MAADGKSNLRRAGVMALALTLGFVLAPDGRAVTLEEAVRAALKTNPDIGVVVENRRAVNQELSQARAGFLPTVDINGSSGHEYASNTTTRARELDGDDSRTTSLPLTTFGFTIRQLLFDGFDTLSQVERQEARVRSAARRVRETSEFIGLDATEAYLESLRQRELIAIAEENVKAHERFLALVQERVKGGAAGRAEEEQARQRLAASRDAVSQADGLRRDADARYRRVMGEEPVEPMIRPNQPDEALPANIDIAIELAIAFNPTIRVSQSDLQVAEAELKQTTSGYWPTLSFEVNGNTSRNSGGTRGQSTTVAALLVMNYNLYRGGADVARRSEFVARLAEARQRLAQTQRATDENTRVAWNAKDNATERLIQLRAIEKANEAIRDAAQAEFDVGRRDLLDLLNAENDYFQAKGNRVSNEFVEMLGKYRLLASTGLLLTALDVEQSNEAFISDAESAEFQNSLQKFVEATPVLNFQNTNTGVPGTGLSQPGSPLNPNIDLTQPLNPLAPLNPNVDLTQPLNPIDPTKPLDPNVDLTQPLNPNADLTQPLNPNVSPNGNGAPNLPPILDPNAPIINPTAPIPGVPQGELPGAEQKRPTPLLRHSARDGQTAMRTTAPFEDKPRMLPMPHQLGEEPPSSAAAANKPGIRSTPPKPKKDVWWFGPVADSENKNKVKIKNNKKNNNKIRAYNWGFD